MSKKVLEALAAKYANVPKGVQKIMGGQILDYEAKDILNQGRAEGRAEEGVNTERERKRAEEAEKRAQEEEKHAREVEEELARLRMQLANKE